MKQKIILALFSFLIFSCKSQEQKQADPANEEHAAPKTTQPQRVNCNDPDAPGICMFMYTPNIEGHQINIAVSGEEQNLTITGKVLNAKTRKPYSGIYLYAYHTDDKGEYSKSGQESGVRKIHGKHHGWCLTDEEGNYEIHTRRPGAYPSRDTPAHIHTWVKIDDDHIFYINDFVFSDDPLLKDGYAASLENKNNPKELDNGIIELIEQDGKFVGKRDILIVE